MNIVICENYEEMSKKACDLLVSCLQANPEGLISLPGGDTPLGLFREFTAAVNSGKVDISSASYVSLDEWVGLGMDDEGSCGHFNKVNLLDKLKKPFSNTHVINGVAKDVVNEKDRLNNFISAHGPLCVSVLGIGLNGHLGFNEEGVCFESDGHITALAETTRQVMKKYFGDRFNPKYGITQGLGQIMKASTVILLANGAHKADILRHAINGPVSNEVPATVLQKHPNVHIFMDEAAAGK